jgi:hypothetical protein
VYLIRKRLRGIPFSADRFGFWKICSVLFHSFSLIFSAWFVKRDCMNSKTKSFIEITR